MKRKRQVWQVCREDTHAVECTASELSILACAGQATLRHSTRALLHLLRGALCTDRALTLY